MDNKTKIKIKQLSFKYNGLQVLNDINVQIKEKTITGIIGPSGNGKSTFLTTINRLWENIPGAVMEGSVEIKFGKQFYDIYAPSFSVQKLRRSAGMVSQIPNPLPMSIFKNVAFPLKLAGIKNKKLITQKVEKALKDAFLWNEVKNRLDKDARSLSGGQQQRLCIARTLILKPDIFLMDEPTSSLDEKSMTVIEELLLKLKDKYTILIVSHYIDQVIRIADKIIEFKNGKLRM